MKNSKDVIEVFRIFQDKESYFDERNREQSNRLIMNQVIIICVFTFVYGIVMGSYHSFLQSVVSGVKVIALFICTIIICFPSFFVIQQVLGSKMPLRQMMIIILSGFVLTSAIALSFSPIIIFFQITGGNYHFLQLLHVAVFLFSGIFGMRLMVDALKFACEKKATYPQIGVTVFRVWIIILAFVGIQLSWNLRPYLCDRSEEFKLFRKHEGNFYAAVMHSAKQLVSDKDVQKTIITKEPFSSPLRKSNENIDTSVLNQLKK